MHTHTHARAHTQTFKTESFDDGSVRLLYDLGVQVTDLDYHVMRTYALIMVCAGDQA